MTPQWCIERETEAITERVRPLLEQIGGRRVFLTGITGLIGSQLWRVIVNYNRSVEREQAVRIGAYYRSADSFRTTFPEVDPALLSQSRLYKFWVGDLATALDSAGEKSPAGEPGFTHYDYIAHLASPTSSRFFHEHPEETRETIVNQAAQILNWASCVGALRTILFSSNEVYGEVNTELALTEDQLGWLDESLPRSSYAVAKRNLERMVQSDSRGNAAVLRLGVCTGVGAKFDDERVYSKMAAWAASGRNIRLTTNGASKLTMISVGDTIAGILTAWLKASAGEIYNLANSANFYSVAEIAHLIRSNFAPEIAVELNSGDPAAYYAPERKIWQDCSKFEALGWTAIETTAEIYRKLFDYFSAIYRHESHL